VAADQSVAELKVGNCEPSRVSRPSALAPLDAVPSRDPGVEVPRAPLAVPIATELAASGSDPESGTSAGRATGLSTQVARAGSWGLAGRSVLLLANFAATPFTIRLLGPSAYGLWAIIQAVLVWVNLAEGGMGNATTKYGSECYTHGDDVGEATIVWTGLGFVLGTTVSVALAVALSAHFLLVLLHVNGATLEAGTWALRVSCGAFVVGALAATVNTAQQVRLRWKQFTFFYTISNLVGSIGVPLAIYLFSGGLVTAAMVGLFAQAINLLGLSWDGARVQPELLHPRFDRSTLRKLVSYGGMLTIANFVGIPLMTGERLFLSANASTTAVAYYAVAATVATTLLVIPEQLMLPLLPALARLESEGKTEEYRSLYGKSLSGMFLLVTPATLLLALVARPFLTLWAGPTYAAHGAELLLIVLVGVWAYALSWVTQSYMLSAAKTKTLAWLQAVELGPYLGAAWVLTAKWGAVGAAVVWSVRLVLDCIVRFVIVHRSAGLPWLPLSERRLRSLAAPATLGLGCFVTAILTRGLAARAGAAAELLVVYGAGLWWMVLTSRERRGVINLVGDILGSKRPDHWKRFLHADKARMVGSRRQVAEPEHPA
jgi:O-antigen/teichoic acid export membrane protein